MYVDKIYSRKKTVKDTLQPKLNAYNPQSKFTTEIYQNPKAQSWNEEKESIKLT